MAGDSGSGHPGHHSRHSDLRQQLQHDLSHLGKRQGGQSDGPQCVAASYRNRQSRAPGCVIHDLADKYCAQLGLEPRPNWREIIMGYSAEDSAVEPPSA